MSMTVVVTDEVYLMHSDTDRVSPVQDLSVALGLSHPSLLMMASYQSSLKDRVCLDARLLP